MTDDLPGAALTYAASGWPVFPCAPHDKRPLGRIVPHGLKDATTDPERVALWWRAEPQANIGVSCGAAGLLVLDVDGAGGEAAILALQERYGTLGETRWQRTGGGGWQAFFAETGGLGNTCGRLGPGLDTRAAGGYVILPPSVHPSGGTYIWWDESAPIAPLPPWLLRLLTDWPIPATLRALKVGDGYVRAAVEREAENVATAPQGRRNETLNVATFSLARLIGERLSESELVTAMLDAAAACGLPAAEARRTIASAIRARPSPVHASSPRSPSRAVRPHGTAEEDGRGSRRTRSSTSSKGRRL